MLVIAGGGGSGLENVSFMNALIHWVLPIV
jgi:hypothetical protein